MKRAKELLAKVAEKAQATLQCLPRQNMSQPQNDLQNALDEVKVFLAPAPSDHASVARA